MLSEFHITQRGESHKRHDAPCQDHSDSFSVTDTGEARYVVAMVADGVGSEELSDRGSRTAVDVVAAFLKDRLASDEQIDDMTEVIEGAFEEALEATLDLADELQEPFSKFATTLTVAVYDGATLWYGHAGDDGIVAMRRDGTYSMITERHEGELANSVVPFGVRHWQFGEEENVASCALMTDGILDYCVSDEFEDERVRLPFLEPLLYAVLETKEDVDAVRADWDAFLASEEGTDQADDDVVAKPVFRDFVGDDLSIALLSSSESVACLPEYSFDLDAWNADTARYDAIREERLAELDSQRLEEDDCWQGHIRPEERDEKPGVRHPDAAAEWPQALASGASDVIRGIGVIGNALGDAVQQMLRKP